MKVVGKDKAYNLTVLRVFAVQLNGQQESG